MIIRASDDVSTLVAEAVPVYEGLFWSVMIVPRSEYGFPWRTETKEAPTSSITGFTVSMVTNEPSVIFLSVTRS